MPATRLQLAAALVLSHVVAVGLCVVAVLAVTP
jgi:hypothetical protein